MRIAMPRGDIRWIRFLVHTFKGDPTDIEFTNIYFTVKKRAKDKEFLFQKSLQHGNIYRINTGDYQFKIDPEDTNNLAVSDYKFDIQISYKNLLKESFVGDFVVKEEVTYYYNEDYDDGETDFTLPQTPESSAVILCVPDYHLLELTTPVDIADAGGDYSRLTNHPTINGVEVVGDLTLQELGIQPAETCPLEALTAEELDVILGSASSAESLALLAEARGNIELSNNILSPSILFVRDTTVDLCGHTITAAESGYLFTAQSAKVIFKNGSIVSDYNLGQAVNGGEIVIESGLYTAGQTGFAAIGENSKITVQSGVITCQDACIIISDGGEIEINGGEFTPPLE